MHVSNRVMRVGAIESRVGADGRISHVVHLHGVDNAIDDVTVVVTEAAARGLADMPEVEVAISMFARGGVSPA